MTGKRSIGFVGAGNMAEALMRGLQTRTEPPSISAYDPHADRLEQLHKTLGIRQATNNHDLVTTSSTIVLAVKPQIVTNVLDEIAQVIPPDVLVISIAAGVPLQVIESHLQSGARVVRAMPNTPALVGAGATAISRGTHATEADLDQAKLLFDAVGTTICVAETLLDAVTGLSGSGPAYVFLILESLIEGAIAMGLTKPDAERLSIQTVLGAATLASQSGESPEQLRKRVTSPNGTTVAGLQALEQGSLRNTIMQAVAQATRRARELGEEAKQNS